MQQLPRDRQSIDLNRSVMSVEPKAAQPLNAVRLQLPGALFSPAKKAGRVSLVVFEKPMVV